MPPSKKMSGHEIRRELLGDDLFRRNEGIYNNEVMKEFSELTNVTIFENIWGRPGLDLKTRSLITVVSDVVAGRLAELEIHIEICIRQGWSKDELKETMFHLLAYAGGPAVRSSLLVAVRVFDRIQ
jgi:alkylhydroperoxidase/carboxymuconolactone decarboxylase family protein YurZ